MDKADKEAIEAEAAAVVADVAVEWEEEDMDLHPCLLQWHTLQLLAMGICSMAIRTLIIKVAITSSSNLLTRNHLLLHLDTTTKILTKLIRDTQLVPHKITVMETPMQMVVTVANE